MGRAGTASDILDLGSWFILRCSSADTLKTYRALSMVGLEVWTPIEKRMKRMPRTRATYDKEIPLMPSYVFGHVRHLSELLRLAMVPNKDLPRFSLFQFNGGIPLIADDQLDALRAEEDRTTRVFEKWKRRGRKGPKLAPGTQIRLPDGPFAGISGIVEGTEGQFTLVDIDVFGKSQTIKIASLLLAESVAQDGLPIEANAARAA